MKKKQIEFKAQAGPQTAFLTTHADIAIYGGAAGGGKTYALLLDPLRHLKNKLFGGVIFRRTSVQVKNEGGLWDESDKMYPFMGGIAREFALEWRFRGGMALSFSHLEYDKDLRNFQGSQIPWIGFDELTHFSEKQFFYMLSRNRSTSGVKPKIRATCNPDPDSWVRRFIDWWIDPKTGYAIPERSGKIRWFIRLQDHLIWAGSKEELHQKYGRSEEIQPKSVTFIPAKLTDNKILMKSDPAYLGNLLALNRVDRERLKEGNWNIRATAGTLFQREWFRVIDTIPGGYIREVRAWDRAATRPSETNPDPDWTRGLRLLEYPNGIWLIADLKSIQGTPGEVERLVVNTASHDGYNTQIYGEQDPGSAGVSDIQRFTSMLAGFDVRTGKPSKDKVTRAKPVSAQAEAGNVHVLRAPWNEELFTELENFSEDLTGHDDIVDALSGAFNSMQTSTSMFDIS